MGIEIKQAAKAVAQDSAEDTNALKNRIRRQVAEIERVGEKLVIPAVMTVQAAIELLQNRLEYEKEVVHVRRSVDVFPWDGALALDRVLTRKYGWAPAKATQGFFGPNPPQIITVDVAYGKVASVPWGAFQLPTIDGTINCGVDWKDNRLVFEMTAKVKRKSEDEVNALFDEVAADAIANSIYRGKAIKLRFCDDSGDRMKIPQVQFLDAQSIDENNLVYSDEIMAAVRTNLFTPIQRATDCLANGIPVKRGVLLGGVYGTGKTMAAAVASKLAEQNGITFIYCARADELNLAIEFAKQYQSPAACVFCEDIDRVMDGARSVQIDDILNTIDGIDSKASNVIVVLTTNKLDNITPAMLRPGRLDAVIEVLPPDARAVERLLRVYGRGLIPLSEDLSLVGEVLNGQIPAIIAEVLKRAKLSQLSLLQPGERIQHLSAEALLDAARTLTSQIRLIERQSEKENSRVEDTFGAALGKIVANAVEKGEYGIGKKVSEIHDHVIN